MFENGDIMHVYHVHLQFIGMCKYLTKMKKLTLYTYTYSTYIHLYTNIHVYTQNNSTVFVAFEIDYYYYVALCDPGKIFCLYKKPFKNTKK